MLDDLVSSEHENPKIDTLRNRKLTHEQVVEIKALVEKYLDRLDTTTLVINFPPNWAYILGFIIITIGSISIWRLPSGEDYCGRNIQGDLTFYLIHHLTIAAILAPLVFVIHKVSTYVLLQYYSMERYRILTINRIAIFATIILNGGEVQDDAYRALVTDEQGDDKATAANPDLKTLYEKIVENGADVAKEAIKALVEATKARAK